MGTLDPGEERGNKGNKKGDKGETRGKEGGEKTDHKHRV